MVAGFDRGLVDETRESVGQGVRANLASVEVRVPDLPARFDLVGRAAFGAYTGSGLASNRRAGLEGEVGWVVLTYRPWVRVGYTARSASFRYNAASGFAAAPDSAGGYFSPDRYVAQLGLVQMSHRFGRWVQWSVDARGGAEIVRQRTGEASDTRGAAVLVSEATILLGAQMDVGLRYLYVDAFDVFRMHQAALLLRRHF